MSYETFGHRDYLRIERIRPYLRGMGPSFVIAMWATSETDWRGQTRIGYVLRQLENGAWSTIFEGEDFAGSPLNADDSDDTLAALMGFLTLRPGDTDAEYFNNYTREQLDFASEHAEALGLDVLCLWGGL